MCEHVCTEDEHNYLSLKLRSAANTFSAALELHPDCLVDVFGEVEDTFLFLLFLILIIMKNNTIKTQNSADSHL